MLIWKWISTITLIFLFLASTAIAATEPVTSQEPPSKIGAEVKAIKSSGFLGTLFGWRYMNYESSSFSIGGAGYTGQLSQGASGSFTYGGLEAGYLIGAGQKMEFEFLFLAGGGGGFTSSGSSSGGVVFEPTLSVGLILGKSVRSTFNIGYLWLPSSPTFSGITAGLRFDFLSLGEK